MILQDARVPVVFGPVAAGPDDVRLVEGDGFAPQAAHAPGCACCGTRNPAGRALAALLQARARGEIGFFRRVVVDCATEAGRRQAAEALRSDPVASLCFRQES